MKLFKAKLALIFALVMVAAILAPAIVQAHCPDLIVQCSNGGSRMCLGTSDGNGHCLYNEDCMNCKRNVELLE